MKFESSKLARLVIAYHEKFGRHAPESVLRRVDAGDLATMLEDSLASGVRLVETGWGWDLPMEFSPRGCIVGDEEREAAPPTKGPDGEWLQ